MASFSVARCKDQLHSPKMSRWLKCTSMHFNTDWNKYDDRLMKAVERGEVDKVAAVLSKKGIIPTKLDVEGRSAFHLAATRGHLDCLNLILGHSVDVTATDATGKNALHLASRNGHSLCVQKLLQHNCPVGNVDLQGRTALHDAVMGGCPSNVKLLCDSGASVNATDFDGRTPLVLATQMCHPHICQLLLERGADITIRDKQSKTAMILGCEYGCKEAVEVLLMSGADVKAVDGVGHDAFHYARLSKNQELVALVKTYLDKANREKEAAKKEHWKRKSMERTEAAEASWKEAVIHDLERKNETLEENLRKFQQDQRALVEKVNVLQQQLTQEKMNAEESQKEKEELRFLVGAKEKDEGARGVETVKVQLRSSVADYSGQSVIKGKENVLVKQALSLDSEQLLQNQRMSPSRAFNRSPPAVGWDLNSELDTLRCELETVRKRQQAAEEETVRLQSALNLKSRECQELTYSRDMVQKQADQQIQELEDALGDVQKRMVDSECKVKQLQAHVVAVKEHFGGQVADELRAQIQDIKGKYEGASAEVGRVRNRLKQSEKALEEYKSSESQLAAEAEQLHMEIEVLTAERDKLAENLLDLETELNEAKTKHGNTVPAEKFDNMKNLLTNAVDEKERQLAELREDYDRVLKEVAELHQKLDSPPTKRRARSPEDQRNQLTALLEENASLDRRLREMTVKNKELIDAFEESEADREMMERHLNEVNKKIDVDFVPIEDYEEAVETMKDKLQKASDRFTKAEAQVKQLQAERDALQENVDDLHGAKEKHQRDTDDLMKKLEVLEQACKDRDSECVKLTAQSQNLKQSLEDEYISRDRHEQVTTKLSSALKSLEAEKFKLETKEMESREEFQNVKEGNERLKEKLEKVLLEMKNDCVTLKEHKSTTDKLNAAIVEAENRANEFSAMYTSSQEETERLTLELKAQKMELETIHEAIQSRFIPLTAVEEKENSHSSQLEDLKGKLMEMEDQLGRERSARETDKEERDRLRAQVETVQQRLDAALDRNEKLKESEREVKVLHEEVTLRFNDLEQQHQEVTTQKAKLEDQHALCNTQIQNLQDRLKSELTRIATYDTELKALHDAVQQTQTDCKRAREAQQEEAQKVCSLQTELRDKASVLQLQIKAKESLEAEVTELRMALREEEDNNGQRAEDISALQSELLQATQALEELRHKEDQMNQLKKEKQQLQEEAADLSNKLLSQSEERDKAQQEAAKAWEGESQARREKEVLQEKGRAVEKEISQLKERYDDSLGTIRVLQRRIQTSAQQTEAKDKKITELLTDVERLKQALNGLSQLAYTSNSPSKGQTQHIDTLHAQIKSLQQQLADAEKQHREVISIYRTHLLSAAQGHMDEDVQAALLQIIRMRQEFLG
ncbi:uveal autoantigen with coiled-coil domains and ankyrin repeats isoform 1-T1 [Synchiropus picturatus]